jgi:hypothetical protein
MKIKIFFILILFVQSNIKGSIPKESYIHENLIKNGIVDIKTFHETRQDGTLSKVTEIKKPEEFAQKVVKNEKPVVVKISVDSADQRSPHAFMYQNVADEMSSKDVEFVSMEVKDNTELISNIMLQLGMTELKIPTFLFFKQGSLLLPPYHDSIPKNFSAENKDRLRSRLVSVIKEKFEIDQANKTDFKGGVDKKDSDKKSSPGLIEKIRQWFISWRTVSNEAKAYQETKRLWKRERSSMG